MWCTAPVARKYVTLASEICQKGGAVFTYMIELCASLMYVAWRLHLLLKILF